MKLKILKLHTSAIIPHYSHPGDAGLDLFSIQDKIILPGEAKLILTGIAIALPEGTEAQIRPRSGLALKHSVTVLNTPGTIDAGYRGEIGVILINHARESFQVSVGMKIAQMVITSYIQAVIEPVEKLDETTRGDRGFGSTGVFYN
jgi:dUTP pyrophosphatase